MLKAVLPPEGVALDSLASNSSLSFAQAARVSKAALSALQRAVREILPTRISQQYRPLPATTARICLQVPHHIRVVSFREHPAAYHAAHQPTTLVGD